MVSKLEDEGHERGSLSVGAEFMKFGRLVMLFGKEDRSKLKNTY
jgi:hypothetical protein